MWLFTKTAQAFQNHNICTVFVFYVGEKTVFEGLPLVEIIEGGFVRLGFSLLQREQMNFINECMALPPYHCWKHFAT